MESTEAKLDALAAQLERDLNSVADRDATLNELMGYLAPSAHATDAVKQRACLCLRLFLRDQGASRTLYNEASVATLVHACDLPAYAAHEALSREAIKCLVNFAIRAMEIERANNKQASDSVVLRVMRGANWGPLVLQTLQSCVAKSSESDDTFALCRLLNMVVWEPAMRESVSNQSMVDLLLALFSEHVAALDSGVPSTRDAMRFNIAGDAVRIMFQLTSEYGPLSDGTANAARAYPMTSEAAKVEAEVAAGRPAPAHLQALWLHSVEPLKRALLLDFHDPSRRQLQLSCMTYALNLPRERILSFDAYKVLPYLIKILGFHLQASSHDAAALTTIFMLFCKITRDEPQTRALFMTTIFPHWQAVLQSTQDPVQMPPQHKGTLGEHVINCMQSTNTGLQFFSNEFVFLLCNENAGAFTRFVGFGSAAGHLAMRGLMKIGGDGGGQDTPSSVDADGVASGGGDGGDGGGDAGVASSGRATNWQERSIPEPDLANLSEEDRREWNELLDKMERLDKLGVIKMVSKPPDKSE